MNNATELLQSIFPDLTVRDESPVGKTGVSAKVNVHSITNVEIERLFEASRFYLFQIRRSGTGLVIIATIY